MPLFQHKGELVERYLDALRCNPHAVPPQELDPETAEMLRTFVALYLLPEQETVSNTFDPDQESAVVQQRVWDRVMFGILAPPNVQPNYLPGTWASKIIAMAEHKATASRKETLFVEESLTAMPALFRTSALYTQPRRRRMKSSLVAAILVAVFCMTGIVLRLDVLMGEHLRYTPSMKTQVTMPTLDNELVSDVNPNLYTRFQPSDLSRDVLVIDRAESDVEEGKEIAFNIPVSPSKNFPD
jgi:hypothetical protein